MSAAFKDLGHGVTQINLIPADQQYASTGYLVVGPEKKAIIETGSSPAHGVILQCLKAKGISPEEIDYIIVTHIHMDHAGGAGLLMKDCRKAVLYGHEKGLPHLIDPSRLEASSRVVYGDKFDRLFGPIVPVEASRTKALADGMEIDLGGGRKLLTVETPGHALHHHVIWDQASRGIFSGDAAGMYYNLIEDNFGVRLNLPATTPTQFDPETMRASYQRMLGLKPERIYFTHFGMGEPAQALLENALEWLDLFGIEGRKRFEDKRDQTDLHQFMLNQVKARLQAQGVPKEHPCLDNLVPDLDLSSQGIAAYVHRLDRLKEKAQS